MGTYKLNHMICVAALLSATVLTNVTSARAEDTPPEGWGTAPGAPNPTPKDAPDTGGGRKEPTGAEKLRL